MHRSGTSVVANSLQTLGISLGNHLMEPHPCNPRGFFEDLDFFEMNERLLYALGQKWSSISPIYSERFSSLSTTYRDEAVELVRGKFNRLNKFAFKDPRTAVLLPFWNEIFRILKIKVKYVFVFRNPLAVAESLKQRDGFSLQSGILMWSKYNISALSFVNRRSCIFVDYDTLMVDPVGQFSRLESFVSTAVLQSNRDNLFTEFLDASLRHSVYTEKELRAIPDLPEQVVHIYHELLEAAINNSGQLLVWKNVNKWERWFTHLSFYLSALDACNQ